MKLLDWYSEKGFTTAQAGVEAIKEELGIKVREYPEEGLFVFNYDQIESPKTHPVVQACRGSILDNDLNIVCRPPERFYNVGEALEVTERLDWDNATAYEKADGSFVKVYKWKGLWRVATRGTAFAEVENYTGRLFSDMILEAFGVESIERLSKVLDENIYPTACMFFEFTSPQNRVVTPYDKPEMVLIAVIDRETGEELPVETLAEAAPELLEALGARMPETYKFSDKDSLKRLVNRLEGLQEGVVIWDGKLRVKMKSELYVQIHRLRGDSLPTPKRLRQLVVTNEVDEYLAYFPEEADTIAPYQKAYELLKAEMAETFERASKQETQKGFALEVKDYNYSFIMFNARGTGVSPVQEFYKATIQRRSHVLEEFMKVAVPRDVLEGFMKVC